MTQKLHINPYVARLLNHIDALPQGASIDNLGAPVLHEAKAVHDKKRWQPPWLRTKLAEHDAGASKMSRVLERMERHGYLFSRMERVGETKRRWEAEGNPHTHPEQLRLYFLSHSGKETLRLCRLSRIVE